MLEFFTKFEVVIHALSHLRGVLILGSREGKRYDAYCVTGIFEVWKNQRLSSCHKTVRGKQKMSQVASVLLISLPIFIWELVTLEPQRSYHFLSRQFYKMGFSLGSCSIVCVKNLGFVKTTLYKLNITAVFCRLPCLTSQV